MTTVVELDLDTGIIKTVEVPDPPDPWELLRGLIFEMVQYLAVPSEARFNLHPSIDNAIDASIEYLKQHDAERNSNGVA